ncbi:hypothetical protein QJQ45_029674 [Haematococcus lacustris]|nr:hypothetical protein QJQ45_029674 [Haematococcus lacustris]
MDVAEGVMAPTPVVQPEPAAAPPASNAPPAVAAHTGQKALPSGDPSLQPEHPAAQPPQQHANHAPPHPPQATPVQPRPAPASAPSSEPADSSSKSGTQAGSLAVAAAPDLGHLSAPVAVTIRPIRPRSTPTAGSRPTPLLTKRLSGGVSERYGTQPATPAAPSPGPVSQQAALAGPGAKASAALSSPAVSLMGKALQQASPNSTSSGSKGTPLTSPALSSGTKVTPLTSPALSSRTKGTPLTSPALSSGTKTVPLITQVAKPPAAGANVSPKLAMLARSEAAAAAAAPPRTAEYESSAAAVTGSVKMANVPVRPGHHSSAQQLMLPPAGKSDEDRDSKQLPAHQPTTPSVQQPAPSTPASSLEVVATAAAMPVSAISSRKPGEAAATSVSPAPNLAPASPQTSHTSASRQPGHAGPLAPAAPSAPAAAPAGAAAAAELPTSSRAASPNLPVFSDARQGSSSSSVVTAESQDKAPSPHPTAASHPEGLPCTLPVLPAEPSRPAQQALAAALPAASTSHQPAHDSSLEMAGSPRARLPNPSALPCGDAADSRHVTHAATLAQAVALVRGSKAAAPAEETLAAAGGSKAVAAWMQDYSATVERLELVGGAMVLQAQQMQMEVLEVRAQAAILQNRTVRLDNPKLRSRLADVMDRYHACIAMPVPSISQYLTT